MYISHKSNVIQHIHETEWQCRRNTKGQTKIEYWAWIDSITSGDPPVVDLSGETGYTIVECTDENVQARLVQLNDYQADEVYNIKWSDDKVDGSHFIGDDDAKNARLLTEELVDIRRTRTRLLEETDWMASSDVTLNAAWRTYRQELRDLPSAQGSVTSYDDINWPSKPS